MKRNEAIALIFGTICAYMVLIGIWGCADESHKGWVDVGIWHPFILLGMAAADALIVALNWPLIAGKNEIKRLEKSLADLRSDVFREMDQCKILVADREMEKQ